MQGQTGDVMMQTFSGTLQSTSNHESPLTMTLQIDGDRIRMWSDRRRIGSWSTADVVVERHSIFRFLLSIDEEVYQFTPDDPSGFAEAVDLVVDLTKVDRPRFGLAARIRDAAEAN